MKSVALTFLASAAALATPSTALAASPPKLSLRYFDLRGAAETARVLLALGDMDYDDVRYKFDPATFKSEAFIAAKEKDELIINLNRAPVLAVEDGDGAKTEIGQSKAIERYLAKKMGLMGKTAEEEAVVDCIAEHCRDVKDAAMRKGFSQFTKDKTDEEKAAAREEWFKTEMPEMMKKINTAVERTGSIGDGDDGSCFAVGTERSYADVAVWALLQDCPPADLADTTGACEGCARLNAIADSVAAHPGVARWLKERPESMF